MDNTQATTQQDKLPDWMIGVIMTLLALHGSSEYETSENDCA